MVWKPYWVAYRLYRWAQDNWAILDGAYCAQGIDLARLCVESPSRFLSTIYVIYMQGLSENERLREDFKLNEPPPWEDPDNVSEETARSDAAAFMAAQASFSRTGA